MGDNYESMRIILPHLYYATLRLLHLQKNSAFTFCILRGLPTSFTIIVILSTKKLCTLYICTTAPSILKVLFAKREWKVKKKKKKRGEVGVACSWMMTQILTQSLIKVFQTSPSLHATP